MAPLNDEYQLRPMEFTGHPLYVAEPNHHKSSTQSTYISIVLLDLLTHVRRCHCPSATFLVHSHQFHVQLLLLYLILPFEIPIALVTGHPLLLDNTFP